MSSGVAVEERFKKLASDNVALKKYLYILARIEKGQLVYVDSERISTAPIEDDDAIYQQFHKDCEEKIVVHSCQVKDETPRAAFTRIKEILTAEPAAFMIYNCVLDDGSKRSKSFLIRWVDDDKANMRTKMVYASSSSGIGSKLPNLASNIIQCNDGSELTYDIFKGYCKTL
ncbi:uncharacterized protein [Antedon mediterranea]|uniref:uncharacterized protein n=1 Tax=Antedon mediterranea TaxID=105859 RepID=UPI003AF91BBD